jgi:hypothetical protein
MFTPTSTCGRATDDTPMPQPATSVIANQRLREMLITFLVGYARIEQLDAQATRIRLIAVVGDGAAVGAALLAASVETRIARVAAETAGASAGVTARGSVARRGTNLKRHHSFGHVGRFGCPSWHA